jgi:nicotinamide-nucleotide amidase
VVATICAHDFEVRVDLVADPGAEERAAAVEASLVEALAPYVFARDARPVEELVLSGCRELGWSLAAAESCTGGLVAARLTSVPGSSDVFVGGVVAYSNAVKEAELGVPQELIAAHGAVAAEVAEAMTAGARERLGADAAVAVTGVAGPGGGSDEKPVGLVYIHAATPAAERALELLLPGDRAAIRSRATAAALHLVRRLLAG